MIFYAKNLYIIAYCINQQTHSFLFTVIRQQVQYLQTTCITNTFYICMTTKVNESQLEF